MKFIQTLFINKDPLKNSFGWAASEYHLMSWALSSLQLHKIYQSVELYANSNAAEMLIDTLELPYNKVNITHDNLYLPNENLWALPKMFTYSLQKEPFLHVDGDVFLFDQFPISLLKNELIAQNIEEATNYYTSTQKELMANFDYFPDCVKADFFSSIPIRGVNAGILGGNNIAFIKDYTQAAFEYINRNVERLPLIIVDRFNIFFEQHLFYSLAKERNIPIGVLINDVINDNEYKYIGDIHKAPCCRSYLHLLGHLKKDEYTCTQMAAKLRDLYPEYYYKVMRLFTKHNASSLSFYCNEGLDSMDDFSFFNKEARNVYSNVSSNSNEKLNDHQIPKAGNNETFDLALLQKVIDNYIDKPNCSISNRKLQNDFEIFADSLKRFLNGNMNISPYWLYGRDLESANWYCELFGNDSKIESKIVSKSGGISIIESEFDWAGLLNKHKRVGVKYYETLELLPGRFFNLLIPEVSATRFSLFDLDEMEKLILDYLSTPLSIKELLITMQSYAEDDVIQHHLEIFNNLIITFLKQLVVKKAVKPV
jgi:hypothetical protein